MSSDLDAMITAGEVIIERIEQTPSQNRLCPFCGGEGYAAKQIRDGYAPGDEDAYCHYIACRSCAAEGPWCKSGESGAWRDWNRRVNSRKCN